MRALVVLLAVVACKDSHAPSKPPPEAAKPPPEAAKPPPAVPADAPAPTLDGPADKPAPQYLSVEEATDLLPRLAGDVVIKPQATEDHHQVHATWCLPGSAADAVVHDLEASLTKAGWTNVSTRGDATKAGVSAEREHYRASYVVSASSIATCRAPGHYFASLTMFRMRD